MLPSLAWSVYYADGAQMAIVRAIVATAGLGGAMYLLGRLRRQDLFRKEATAVVGLGWLLSAAMGALPFYFARAFPSYVDCFFECMSGLTTTGASVLTDFEAMPKGLLFWRSFTHWLGGMGIIVLFVALLPFLGAGGRALIEREVPGPVTETLTPRVKDTAVLLWKIYCGLTIAETLILMLCGMSFFDALCHTFGTLATGGFSTHPASIAGFDSLAIELVVIVFMIAAGTNFALYYGVLRGRRGLMLRDPEWRCYMGLIAGSILFVAVMLARSDLGLSFGRSLREAAFQVPSIMTTTGFATADFNAWPTPVKLWLVLLMFVGGSAGSTGGGIKVVRWIILAKVAWGYLERIYSPRTVRKTRLGNVVLDTDLANSILVFFFIWAFVFCLGSFLVALLEGSRVDLVTATTSVAATLNNIGPGLGLVGATENYAAMQPATKVLLSFLMVLGRLELYTILVLFAPRFWRAK
ncbi:TrkH family potassium uptake protein [Candidatus Sumerlaeota bacterium]|nr:TrkH family potassium uptake protein [Candidatus Sumerlaeota bacterium]